MTLPVRVPVAVLGATGAVGQKFVALLADHPWFDLVALTASTRSAGKRYADAVRWLEPTPLPDRFASMPVLTTEAGIPGAIAFSALDAGAAESIEPAFAAAGYLVVTNARPYTWRRTSRCSSPR